MIGVLTAAPWHNSIGDIATAQATLAHLASRGVPAAPVTVGALDAECLVIGGGDIISDGVSEPWASLLAHFQQPGRHVLNAVGVDVDIIDQVDWSFARDYRMVSVRDNVVAERLASRLPDVRVCPCPAAVLEPLPWTFVAGLPGYERLSRVRSGEYVVVHRHPAVAPIARRLGVPRILVDPQAWHPYRWRGRGLELPWTHSPAVMLALVAGARAVITYSLHLAIFALSQRVPFAVVDLGPTDGQSNKIRRYLARAGIDEAMLASTADPLTHAESLTESIRRVSERERRLAIEHLDEVTRVVSGAVL